MPDIEGLHIEHKLIRVGSDVLCVFLPSGRLPNSISVYPRLGWRKKLPDLDLLYLADPFQEVEEFQSIGGSWFISPAGDSALPSIAKTLGEYITKNGYRKAIFYGSSMGAYGAIILGNLIPGSSVIAECPQLYLEKHANSRKILDCFCTAEQRQDLPNAVSALLDDASGSSFTIVANAFDHEHLDGHILPLLDLLRARPEPFKSQVNFVFYVNDVYPRNHSALQVDDVLYLIKQAQGIEAVSQVAFLKSQVEQLTSQAAWLASRLEEIEASQFTKLARLYYRLAQSPPIRPLYRFLLRRKPAGLQETAAPATGEDEEPAQ